MGDPSAENVRIVGSMTYYFGIYVIMTYIYRPSASKARLAGPVGWCIFVNWEYVSLRLTIPVYVSPRRSIRVYTSL